jgi:quercetin dioxygenase-like cupin family protein
MITYIKIKHPKIRKNMNNSKNQNERLIFPKGEKISSPNFIGTAWLSMLATDAGMFDCVIGNVTFEPGARNSWHSHPGGQILLVTSGIGYYQEKGNPIQLIQKGDVVMIKPDILHWHGASPDSQMTHIAISTRVGQGEAEWLEPVSDEEYNSFKK